MGIDHCGNPSMKLVVYLSSCIGRTVSEEEEKPCGIMY